jgi:hypothetical protein
MPTKVLNTRHLMAVVEIIKADGNRDTINIQPSSRVDLPAGSVVTPAYIKAHPEIKIVEY